MGNSRLDWTTAPSVDRCPSCGDWTLTGVMLFGREITLSLVVFDGVSFAAWASGGRRPLYHLVNGGVCLVRAGDTVPIGEWRPEHPCPRSGPQAASPGFVPPCESGRPSMCGRSPQEAAAGVRSCEMCEPVPSEPQPAPRPLAEAILTHFLGAIVVEREINGRVVYRNPAYVSI